MEFFLGEVTRAVDAAKAALQAIWIEDDPRLYLCARYNLARYLTEDGQYREAVAALILFQEAGQAQPSCQERAWHACRRFERAS